AARGAGRIVLRAMDRAGSLRVEEKAKNDFVSEIDRAAEDAIVDTIMRAYPDHGVLGEERGAARPDAEYTWIIDPLDGTTNFLAGIPHFCIAIAVRRGAVLEHGVVVDPVHNEEFSATRGAGARMNDARIRVTNTRALERAIVSTGIPYAQLERHLASYTEMLRACRGGCRSVRAMGAAALDLAYVAAGRTDAFFQVGLQPWDMAAPTVIVREAGGFVADIAGGDRFMETGNLVAANPTVFRELMKTLRGAVQRSGDQVLARG
ncbi:MAG: inositol monophosphatase, partial [Gammaproteobacteria bacterium]|nr:inositol monophosphatase [Gammaproteobacteria bacterium]